MSKRLRKGIFTGLRVAVCAAALAWVLHGVHLYDHATLPDGDQRRVLEVDETARVLVLQGDDGAGERVAWSVLTGDEEVQPRVEYGLLTAWRQSRKTLLLLSLAVFAPVTFLQALRFQLVFRAQEIQVSFVEALKLSFAGNFLNWVTPIGSTGGDVFKAYHVARHTDRKTEAVTTIMLDRIVGLGGLLFLVGVAIEVGAQNPLLRQLGHLIIGGMVVGVICGALFFSARIRARFLPRGLVSRLPLQEQIRRVDAATRRLLRHVPCLGGAVLCTLGLQFLCLSAFTLSAFALEMNFDESKVFDYYACIGTGVVVAAVPISFQGLGTSEAVYRKFMVGSHGTLSQLLCMAMAVRLIHLSWALPGALVALTGAYRLERAAPVVTEQ